MTGWALNLGPQREPTSVPRLRAQRRQTEAEHREAIEVRKHRLALLNFTQDLINKDCEKQFDLSLAEELDSLADAIIQPKPHPHQKHD